MAEIPTAARWKFHPWGRNAKAICERLESLIAEVRLAELRASDNMGTTSRLSTKALLAAIQKTKETSNDQ